MKMFSKIHFTLVAIATLTSCTTGVDYTPPMAHSQPAWHEGKPSLMKKSQLFLTAGWGERQLSALMAKADSSNRSLARARANLDAAIARRNAARSALFPTAGADAEFTSASASETGSVVALPLPTTQSVYASGLNISWEIRSEKGAERFCVISSYISTIRKQGINLMESIKAAFTRDQAASPS